MNEHLTAVATHLPTPHPDYTEARLIRIALQAKVERLTRECDTTIAISVAAEAKVQRLRDELAHALEQFQDAIQREDAMQKGEHD